MFKKLKCSSCSVGASRSAKEVLFQSNVPYTSNRGYIIDRFATLTREFTRTCLFDSRPSVQKCWQLPHRTERASMINSHSCDCYPEFQETVVDGEKMCGNLRVMVVPCLRRPASRYRCLATALFDGTELQGTPARRDTPRRPSNQTFVAVPNLKKKKHISSTTVSTSHVPTLVGDMAGEARS